MAAAVGTGSEGEASVTRKPSHAATFRGPVFLTGLMLWLLMAFLAAGPAIAASAAKGLPVRQQSFASADDAVAALIAAVGADTPAALIAVLGPSAEKLVSSGDPNADAIARKHFLDNYAAQHKLVADGPGRMVLQVGTDDWPLPLPIVQADGRWHFDSAAGAQEIVDRRIGRNEIDAIRVSLAYVDAQQDYFARAKAAGGPGEYAQHLVSTPGQEDGLYWPQGDGEPESPLGPLVRQAVDEGYPGELVAGRPVPYDGYYFRILKEQGPDAAGGAKHFVVAGHMTDGFALVAWPATYRASGIMTFIVNQDGVVFQKDLGPETAAAAAAMRRFDPDLSWARVDIVDK
jgi:hypothetical protein